MRRTAVATLVTVGVVAAFGLAACGGTPSRRESAHAKPSASSAIGGRATTGVVPPDDQSCRPRHSYRPTGALPAAGQMPSRSTMAAIQRSGRLRVGASQDTLLFGSRNPFTGQIEGFDIDIAKLIAKAIFGGKNDEEVAKRLDIRVVPRKERTQWVKDGKVDLVVSTMTATCPRWQEVDFSTTYYQAGQMVLVPFGSPVTGIEDLGGKKVCAADGSTSLEKLRQVRTPVRVVSRRDFGECLVAFQLNEVDAISTDDTILAGMAAQDPYAQVVGEPFSEEPYGIAIAKDRRDFTQFVNAVLEQARKDGTWADLHKKWLGKAIPSYQAPPPPPALYR